MRGRSASSYRKLGEGPPWRKGRGRSKTWGEQRNGVGGEGRQGRPPSRRKCLRMKLEGWTFPSVSPSQPWSLLNPQSDSPVVMTGCVICGAPVRISRRQQQSIKPSMGLFWAWSRVWQHGPRAQGAGCDSCPKHGSSAIEKTVGEGSTVSHSA